MCRWAWTKLAWAVAALGCAAREPPPASATPFAPPERSRATREHALPRAREAVVPRSGEPRGPELEGSLRAYVAYALGHNPELEAAFQDWRASTKRIALARRLPEPTLTYMYFVRSVETRVGPQRHRFGVSQAIPWPGKLTAAADAAVLAARSERANLEAAGLAITARVSAAYYDVWLLAERRRVLEEQRSTLDQLAATVLARVEAGQASLADHAQIALRSSRVADELTGLEELMISARARLRAAIGAPPGMPLPVSGAPPEVAVPAESAQELIRAALAHPRVEALALMAESRRELAQSAEADRYPGFSAGIEYIETGAARMAPAPEDSGKDPIMVSFSLKLPLWFGTYAAAEAEALAQSASYRARVASERDRARAELEQALSKVRDARRRVMLYRTTLVPQATAVFESVLGAYQTNRATVAAALIAERDLLDLYEGLFRAQAEFGASWARLEEVVGRSVPAREAP